MIPWETLDEVPLPGDRGTMTLLRRGHEYVIRIDGKDLMSNRQFTSERELANLAVKKLKTDTPRVLIGGLGLGYTLAATLEIVGSDAEVIVAELVPAVLEWNKGVLAPLAGNPLDDPRAEVRIGDVCEMIRTPDGTYDAILLDVDNGPDGLTQDSNSWLYEKSGLGAARRALNPGGVLAVWAPFEDRLFRKRAQSAGFDVEVVTVKARGKKGARHTIWLAKR